MKFVTYHSAELLKTGVLSPDGTMLYPLEQLGLDYASMQELIAGITPAEKQQLEQKLAGATDGIPVGEVAFSAPIPYPRHDILCVGVNYTAHAMEGARFRGVDYVPPTAPQYFSKRVIFPVGHGGEIPAHGQVTKCLDYEAELAVIFGKTCRDVAPEDVFDYIFGYSIANDISARDIQTRHKQFYFGKSLDGSAPMGPWIVTADEFKAPIHLDICSRVNGELRQNSNTRDFIFDIPYLVSQLSSGMTLEAGDILITGTPSGVGMGFDPPKYLKPGDVVECEIQGIGILRNTVQ